MMRHHIPQKDRFLRHVHKSRNGCWLWTGSRRKGKYGYGLFNPRRGSVDYAHRAAYRLFRGPIPDGELVCHECDNPPCVRPDHLFTGDHSDNIQDAKRKGRLGGEHTAGARLTWAQVDQIRNLYRTGKYTYQTLGRLFGVDPSTVGYIVRRNTWSGVRR